MYNPYENNNEARKPEDDYTNHTQSTQNNQPNPREFRWSEPQYTRPPIQPVQQEEFNQNYNNFYQEKPRKTKKKRNIGTKILAIATSCVLSSAVTVGAFALMIQSGFIRIESQETGNSAFTITKLVGDTNITSNQEANAMTTREIADAVKPSIVCIQNYQITSSNSFWGTSYDEQIGLASEGSGIIMSEDGYIATNAHVVDGATNLKVVLHDNTTVEAEIIGSDNATDLAVIKIDVKDVTLKPAEFGSSSDLYAGDDAIIIGNPGGMSFNSSVATGCISALDREISMSDFGYAMNVIQTDAAINPGNSGGALLNRFGQVVGITSSKFVKEGYEGLGFALPIDDAQPILSDLKQYGYVKNRPMLGIQGQYIDEMTARYNGLSSGMFVAEVVTKQALASGLQKYDVITSIDDEKVNSQTTISGVLVNKKAGDTVKLIVDRAETNQKNIELTLTLSEVQE